MIDVSAYRTEYLSYGRLNDRSVLGLVNLMDTNGILLDKQVKRKLIDGYSLNFNDKYALLNNLEKSGYKIDYRRNFYEQLLSGVESYTTGLSAIASFDLLSTNILGTGANGNAQNLDNNFSQFSSNTPRVTSRGVLCEPASSTSNTLPFDLRVSATWTQAAGTFAAVNAKISIIPGQTAYEFVADATVGTVRNNSVGNFTSSMETISAMVETTATTNQGAAVTFFQVSLNSGNVLRITYTWSTGVILCNGSSTSVTGNVTSYGVGPNGGTLYLLTVSGIPDVASQGGVRRLSMTPTGITSNAGHSIIVHYFQHEPLGVATSPFATSRGADNLSISAPNGTYHVRHVLDNGQNFDNLNITITGNNLPLPTTVYERGADSSITGGGTAKYNLRNGYIKKIELWNAGQNYHVLGDSYVAGYDIMMYLPLFNYRPATWTFDGVPGASLAQHADRFDLTPQYYNDVLIIYDGGLSDDTATALASINRIIAHLPNPKKWVYFESTPNAQAGNEIGTGAYTDYVNKCNAIRAAFPGNYIPTLGLIQQYRDGSPTDDANVSKGWWPNSKLIDGIVHPNEAGSIIIARQGVSYLKALAY